MRGADDMRKTINSLLFCSLILPACMTFAQEQQAAGIDFGSMPENFEQALLKSIFDNDFFAAPQQKATPAPDPALTGFWRSVRPSLSSKINVIRLGFSPVPLADPAAAGPASGQNGSGGLLVEIEFDQEKVIARSISPRSRRFPGGIRFSLNKTRGWRHVLEIYPGLAVAIGVARHFDPDLRGAIVCPFVLPISSGPGLTPAAGERKEYVWSSISLRGDASAHGRFNAGFEPGVGYAAVLSSKTMTSSAASQDEVFAREILVGADYMPEGDPLVNDTTNLNDLSGGLVAQIDLQNPAGYRRLSRAKSFVWAKRLRPQRKFMAGTGRGETEVSPAECIALIGRNEKEEVYSREELRIPPAFITPSSGASEEEAAE